MINMINKIKYGEAKNHFNHVKKSNNLLSFRAFTGNRNAFWAAIPIFLPRRLRQIDTVDRCQGGQPCENIGKLRLYLFPRLRPQSPPQLPDFLNKPDKCLMPPPPGVLGIISLFNQFLKFFNFHTIYTPNIDYNFVDCVWVNYTGFGLGWGRKGEKEKIRKKP
jgi:hypothetical protein